MVIHSSRSVDDKIANSVIYFRVAKSVMLIIRLGCLFLERKATSFLAAPPTNIVCSDCTSPESLSEWIVRLIVLVNLWLQWMGWDMGDAHLLSTQWWSRTCTLYPFSAGSPQNMGWVSSHICDDASMFRLMNIAEGGWVWRHSSSDTEDWQILSEFGVLGGSRGFRMFMGVAIRVWSLWLMAWRSEWRLSGEDGVVLVYTCMCLALFEVLMRKQ